MVNLSWIIVDLINPCCLCMTSIEFQSKPTKSDYQWNDDSRQRKILSFLRWLLRPWMSIIIKMEFYIPMRMSCLIFIAHLLSICVQYLVQYLLLCSSSVSMCLTKLINSLLIGNDLVTSEILLSSSGWFNDRMWSRGRQRTVNCLAYSGIDESHFIFLYQWRSSEIHWLIMMRTKSRWRISKSSSLD